MKDRVEVRIDPKIKGVLPHELNTALALGRAGYTVEFLLPHNSMKTADAYVNGIIYEFKSSEGSKCRTIEHIVKKAAKQCPNLVFDSCRMKKIQDRSVQNYLVQMLKTNRIGLKKILFVNRNREVIDISKIV